MKECTILKNEESVQQRIKELAQQINTDYAGQAIDIVYMLNGASQIAAELVKHLTIDLRLFPFGFTSYPNAPKSGEVCITLDVPESLENKHVLMIEGVVVSGRTPKYLADLFSLRKPASFEICAIGTKPEKMTVELPVKYAAFTFANEIVVGFGVGEGSEKALPYLAFK